MTRSPHGRRWSLRALLLLAVLVASATLAACGSSDDDGATTGTQASTAAAAASTTEAAATADIPPFEGAEADLPTSFPEPEIKDGFAFTIGYSNPSKAVPALGAQQAAVEAEVERLGGKTVVLDAGMSIQKQATDVEQLINQGVDAIILSAMDPNSLTPLLERASKEGIPVFINDLPYKAGLPPVENVAASILSGNDRSAYERAKLVAEQFPGATYGLIGIGIPAPMLDYYVSQVKYWGEKMGLKYVDRVDAETDSPEAGAKAAAALLAKDPDIDVIFAAGDGLAVGAVTAAKQAGNTDVKIVGVGGYKQALQAVKDGDLLATWFTDSGELHRQLVWAAYDTLTEQGGELPAQVTLGNGKIITKDNADTITDPIG